VGLVLFLSPLALLAGLLVALAVYLDLGRPVLFAQERVGLGGRVFKAYKFRTMRGAPREGAYAGEEAERITPLGRFLRRYRLDELPQLWNVLKGEMALVGPRPEQRILAETYAREIPLYALRHTVRPGLTGWAQVHQGYAEGKEETLVKLSYDLYYVRHLSFFLDLRILLRTIWVVLSGFQAK
jgi:lipopolysaccharide/colanic/teichoic acid biosynthesis glycosyltransferase